MKTQTTLKLKKIKSNTKFLDRIKIKLFKYLFTENEKCLLNQALNLQKHEIQKEGCLGLNDDYKKDLQDLEHLKQMCENKLWD